MTFYNELLIENIYLEIKDKINLNIFDYINHLIKIKPNKINKINLYLVIKNNKIDNFIKEINKEFINKLNINLFITDIRYLEENLVNIDTHINILYSNDLLFNKILKYLKNKSIILDITVNHENFIECWNRLKDLDQNILIETQLFNISSNIKNIENFNLEIFKENIEKSLDELYLDILNTSNLKERSFLINNIKEVLYYLNEDNVFIQNSICNLNNGKNLYINENEEIFLDYNFKFKIGSLNSIKTDINNYFKENIKCKYCNDKTKMICSKIQLILIKEIIKFIKRFDNFLEIVNLED